MVLGYISLRHVKHDLRYVFLKFLGIYAICTFLERGSDQELEYVIPYVTFSITLCLTLRDF